MASIREMGQDVPPFLVDFPGMKLTGPTYPGENDGPLERNNKGQPLYYRYKPDASGNNVDPEVTTDHTATPKYAEVDKGFKVTPDSTKSVDEALAYDFILRTNADIRYNLYYRVLDGSSVIKTSEGLKAIEGSLLDKSNTDPDQNGWMLLGESGQHFTKDGSWTAKSVGYSFVGLTDRNAFPKMSGIKDGISYEFAVSLTYWGNDDRGSWNGTAGFQVSAVAGYSPSLRDLGNQLDMASDMTDIWKTAIANGLNKGGVLDIGTVKPLDIPISMTDSSVPLITDEVITPTSLDVTVDMFLTRAGTIYYAVSEVDEKGIPVLETEFADNEPFDPSKILEKGERNQEGVILPSPKLSPTKPDATGIFGGKLARVKAQGSFPYDGQVKGSTKIEGLSPNTTYYIYFTLRGDRTELSDVYVYKFTTTDIEKPRIQMSPQGDGNMNLGFHVGVENGYYRAITQTAAESMIPFLTSSFYSAYTYDEKTLGELAGVPGGTRQVPEVYQKPEFTVLQALTTPYRSSSSLGTTDTYYVPEETQVGYTVFDIYANADARSRMYGLIRNREGISATDLVEIYWGVDGTVSVKAPTGSDSDAWSWKSVDTQLEEWDTNRYYMLTYAINKDATYKPGEESKVASFSAMLFGRSTLERPEISNVIFTYRNGDTPGTYSGTILVTFRDEVRLKGPTTVGAIEITTANLLAGEKVFNVEEGTVVAENVSPNSFRLSFKNVPGDQTLTFDREYFANSNNQSIDKQLIITWTDVGGESYAIATWGEGRDQKKWESAHLQSSAGTTDVKLQFPTLEISGNHRLLKLKGAVTASPKGTLSAPGEIISAVVSPTTSEVVDVTVTNTASEVAPVFTAKAIGKENVTIEAVVKKNGTFVTVKEVVEVTVSDDFKIFIGPDEVPSDNTYVWDREDQLNPSVNVQVVTKDLQMVSAPTVTSGNAQIITNPSTVILSTDKKTATASVQYVGEPGNTTTLQIRVGDVVREIAVTLAGSTISDSGIDTSGLTTLPQN